MIYWIAGAIVIIAIVYFFIYSLCCAASRADRNIDGNE